MLPATMRLRGAFLSLAMAAAAASLGGEARANGRYPAAGLVAVDPSDEDHLVVRSTYGILRTNDGGKSWGWTCEEAVGFSSSFDPMIVITRSGTLLAGLFRGLVVSADNACDWSFYPDLEDEFVIDVSTERGDPSRAVGFLSSSIDGDTFKNQVWETADDGASWSMMGVDLDDALIGLTVDVAPSDAARLYVSGRFGPPDYQGALLRTDDRGLAWQRFDVPGSNDKNLPFLGAIDPDDPDRVYVRLDGEERDTLVMTRNGGADWETLFEGEGSLEGFALSPDGTKVAVGGKDDGLWMADTTTLEFERVSDLHVLCLTWTAKGLYACAQQFVDGFEVGVSTDDGQTFRPLLELSEVCPLECDKATSTGQKCGAAWGPIALTIGSTCGTEGAGGSGSSSSSGSGSGGDPGAGGGCSCATTSGRGAEAIALGALGVFVLAARRRRRRQGGAE
jgi:MYXO-CTERM domain-containing protein